MTPPVFVAFDCMWRRGRDLRCLPLGDRRLVLEREIGDRPLILPARLAQLPNDVVGAQ